MSTPKKSEKRVAKNKQRKASLCFSFFVFCFSLFPSLTHGATSPVANEDAFLLDALWARYRSVAPKDNIKVGVALGGGGARGLAHIGVLKAFEEEDIPVGAIAGTSVGALIGSLYAAGITTSQMEQMSQDIGWSSLTNYSRYSMVKLILTEQKMSTEKMEIYLRKQMDDTRFDQLKIPFACVATDLQTGERVVFREGSVALAARASATIPGLFEPVLFRHRYLVDGGLVTNIPTDLLPSMGADIIVAVDVTTVFDQLQPKSIMAILNQAIYIQSERLAQDEIALAQVVIRPQMGDITMMDLTRSDESINAGIIAGRRAIPEIKKLILDKRFDKLLMRPEAAATHEERFFLLLWFFLLCRQWFRSSRVCRQSRTISASRGWQADIDRASEKGDFGTVQNVRMRLADYAAAVGHNDLAARQYELILASRPGRADRVRYSIRLGKTRMVLQDYVRAIQAFYDALHDSPKDWEANLERARAFSAADIMPRAIESYERCINLRPQEAGPYAELGEVYEEQGFLGKALGYYQKAQASDRRFICTWRTAMCI